MDIGSYGGSVTRLRPEQPAVIEECVGGGGSDGCKREPVGNDEGGGKEDRAVFPVSLEVEGEIRVYDPRDVVYVPRVIERV